MKCVTNNPSHVNHSPPLPLDEKKKTKWIRFCTIPYISQSWKRDTNMKLFAGKLLFLITIMKFQILSFLFFYYTPKIQSLVSLFSSTSITSVILAKVLVRDFCMSLGFFLPHVHEC